MKELPLEFVGKGQVKGFVFTQVKRSEKAYVYLVNTGSTKHYEVFKRKENKKFNCISYPGMNSFGVWAWTCTENTYLDKFEELNLITD